ncbi:MAG: hypothetical protein MI700_04215 [Balneolales bacterium]|nr:hypothetical protein [Balneolales bacterium]
MSLKRRKANNPPTPWTAEDEELLLTFLRDDNSEISFLRQKFPNRTTAGLRTKIRKLRIKHDLFGSSYREEKEQFTLDIARKVKPKSVFDAYAGAGHQTFKWLSFADIVYASEKMPSKLTQFEKTAMINGFQLDDSKDSYWKSFVKGDKQVCFFIGDALDAAVELKANGLKIDLLDLDTCGSTLPLLPTLLLLTKPNHLVITHGEYHSMRFKREDVLRRLLTHKDISQTPFPLEIDDLGKELDKAVKLSALRAHNETADSFWLELGSEKWLGTKRHGMLRRYYSIGKPPATADCINELSQV